MRAMSRPLLGETAHVMTGRDLRDTAQSVVHVSHRAFIEEAQFALKPVADADVPGREDQVLVPEDAAKNRSRGRLRGDRALAESLPEPLGFRSLEIDADDLDRPCERRVHGARTHEAHADAVALEVEPKHLRDPAEAELARAIRRMPGQAEETGGGGYVHEVPALPGANHVGQEALDDVDRTHEVYVHHSLPVPMLEVLDATPDGDSRDVHHDVHASRVGMDRAGK